MRSVKITRITSYEAFEKACIEKPQKVIRLSYTGYSIYSYDPDSEMWHIATAPKDHGPNVVYTGCAVMYEHLARRENIKDMIEGQSYYINKDECPFFIVTNATIDNTKEVNITPEDKDL